MHLTDTSMGECCTLADAGTLNAEGNCMDFSFDDDQELIAGMVGRFADKELAGWAADADRAGQPPARLLAAAGELGLLLDAVPESAGGMLEGAAADYDHVARTVRSIELGRACAGFAALLESNVEPALAVGRWGSDAAQKALYSSLADGGLAALINDWRGKLRVTDNGGGGLILDGKVGPVPVLGAASHALVIAGNLDENGDAGHPVVALLPTASARVEPVTPSGWRAARWGTLACEATAIPDELVLARGNRAAEVRAIVLAGYRLNLAARAVGVTTSAMANAAGYASERVQFGQSIGSFQSLARMQDRHETRNQAARLLTLHAAWSLQRNAADARDTCSRARDFAAETVKDATIDAVQIYGGYGFVNDYPAEKSMRDARAFEIVSGVESFERVLARGPQAA